jgi:hypothetical protein
MRRYLAGGASPDNSAGARITTAAGALQKAGFIRYEQGRIVTADQPGLESASCEYYGTARRAYGHLIGPLSGPERLIGAEAVAPNASMVVTGWTTMAEIG